MNLAYAKTLTSMALAALVFLAHSAPAQAQVAPPLGTAGSYTVLGTNDIPTSGTVTCTTSTIDGDVGTSGNSITNTGPCTITGNIDAPVPAQVVTDFDQAYSDLDSLNPTADCDGVIPIVTATLPPGVYCSDAGTTIPTGVTITLQGAASDVWVFKVGTTGGALTNNGRVVMDGGDACNVYWWTDAEMTMTGAEFAGNVLSGAAITVTDTTAWDGRALATTDVTVTDSTITGCPEPSTGTIIVEKQTNPDGSPQTFEFTGDAADTISDGQQIIVDNLTPGNYSSTETVPAGWALTDIVCNDTDSTGDLGNSTANFILDAGETVTCVFINTEDTATEGTITILKQADPSNTGQAFDFTGDLGNFSLMHGEFIVETLPPGTYAVSETVPAGWQLDSAVCNDGSQVDAIGLEAGENVTCTFTNSQTAALSIPVFSKTGIALIVLMMMILGAVFVQRFDLNRG